MRNCQIFCNAKGLLSDNAMGVIIHTFISIGGPANNPTGNQIKCLSDIVTSFHVAIFWYEYHELGAGVSQA